MSAPLGLGVGVGVTDANANAAQAIHTSRFAATGNTIHTQDPEKSEKFGEIYHEVYPNQNQHQRQQSEGLPEETFPTRYRDPRDRDSRDTTRNTDIEPAAYEIPISPTTRCFDPEKYAIATQTQQTITHSHDVGHRERDRDRDRESRSSIAGRRESAWTRYSSGYDTETDGERRHKSSYVWRVLGYLVLLNPPLCILNIVYALLSVLLVTPILSLCTSIPFSTRLLDLLTPPLLFHLKLLSPHSSQQQSPRPTNPFASTTSSSASATTTSTTPSSQPQQTPEFSPLRLLVVHLLAPILAVITAGAAAVVAFVWLYTEVLLGDRNEETGVEYRMFLWTKGWWEGFVLASVRRKRWEGVGDV